jgi:PAS domain S-box-containing protein
VVGFWNNLPLRTKGWIVLAIPVVALMLGASVFYLQDRREQHANAAVRHTYEVKSELQTVDVRLVTAESSVRGFLNGGNPDTLAEFDTARAALPATFDRLDLLVTDKTVQTEGLPRLRSLVDQRLTALETERDAAIAAGVFPATIPDDVRQIASTARTEVKQQLTTMQAEEDRLLAERRETEETARTRTQMAIVISIAIGLLGSLLATSLFTTGIVGRVRRLATNADRLAEGLPVEPLAPATDEIGILGTRFETASRLLREREAELAHERDLLGALMDNIPYPVFFKDRHSRYLRVNMASARLVGTDDPGQFVGRSDFDFFPPDQAQALFESEQRLMETKEPIVNRVQLTTVGGQAVRWGLDNKAPIVDRTGEVVGLVGSSSDITEMKRAEEVLGHLAAIVESSNDAIVGATLDGTITTWNPSAERLYAYDAAAAIGQPLTMLFPAENAGEVPPLLAQIAEGVPGDRDDLPQRTRSGHTFDAALTLSPVRDAAGTITGAALIARDISAQKQAEVALQTANKELEAFTYSVSHDLRAPLRAMNGFSRILIEDYSAEMPEEARPYLQLVQDNARQMGRLVDDLLAFSRLGRQPVVTRPVRLAELARQVFEDLQADRAGRHVEFEIGDLPVCEVDPGLMRQVLANLISNALKFTRNREVAEIEIGSASEHAQAGEEIIRVRDNGVGFDMAYAHKLFGVFQRLHRAEEYEGTGVGLALVQRIVLRHGGRVWAESAVGRGATFFIALPAAEPSEALVPAGASATAA